MKQMLGIPMSQHPISTPIAKLLDDSKTPMLYPDTHQIVYTRGLIYNVSVQFNSREEPISQVIIQEHSYGHIYGSGAGQSDGNQFPHFNVRPVDAPDIGSV